MKKGRAGTMTHDYKRNGTTTLFAALNMLDGTVIGAGIPRHRHREFLRFLKLIDQQTPAGLDLHLIVDNYATHKTPAVKRWIKLHPRFQLHFTPTSASWLNMVERLFAEITRKLIRRGAFKCTAARFCTRLSSCCQPSTSVAEYGWMAGPVKAVLRPPPSRLTALTGPATQPWFTTKNSTARSG